MPGLLCKTNENYQSSQNEWWSCCWIKDNEFQEFLAYSGLDENIIISKLEHGDLKEVDKITVPQSQAISHINKHHFKPWVVSTAISGQINIWNIKNKEKLFEYVSSPCVLWSSFFTPSDNHLCVPSNNHENGGISVTDIEKNQEVVCFHTKTRYITSACVSVDNKLVACCSPEGVIEVYEYSSSKLIYMVEGHAMPIRKIAYSCDGNFLITASQDSLIKVYDGRNSTFVGSILGHNSWVTGLSVHPTSNIHFISSSLDGTIKLWDIQNRSCLDTFTCHKGGAWDVSYNHDASLFASVGEFGDVCVFAV